MAAILLGLLVTRPAIAQAPPSNSLVINPPYGPILTHVPTLKSPSPKSRVEVRRHNTRAEKQISVEGLQQWLLSKGSPLAPYSAQLLQSPHWSTIIGICTIEQYGCTKAPYNNYWGIGGRKGLQRYSTLESGIQAISDLLATYEAKGKDTIEELNCYYVVPCSPNWLNTVLKTKAQLEGL